MSYVFNIFQKKINKTDDSWKRKIIAAVKMRRREYMLYIGTPSVSQCMSF